MKCVVNPINLPLSLPMGSPHKLANGCHRDSGYRYPPNRSNRVTSAKATAVARLHMVCTCSPNQTVAIAGFASNDLYVFSTTLLQTSGEVPSPRVAHGAALTSANALIWGGITNFSNQNVVNQRQDDSLYLLNLGTSYLLMARRTPASCAPVSREWSRFVVNCPGPNSRNQHTTIVVGSKLFVFGGRILLNDMWALDLNNRTFTHRCSEPS